MPSKQKRNIANGVHISLEDYTNLVKTMDELAFRGPKEESLMVRVANAGGFSEVLSLIKKRRQYAKNLLAASGNSNAGDVEQPAGNSKRKATKGKGKGKKRPTTSATGDQSGDGTTGG